MTAAFDHHIDTESPEPFELSEREITAEFIESASWPIWAYCRDNANSLDAVKHRKVINEAIQGVIGDVQRRIETLEAKLIRRDRLIKQKNRAIKKRDAEIAELKKTKSAKFLKP